MGRKKKFDELELRRQIALLRCPPDALIHVWAKLQHMSGFFDDVDALVAAVEKIAGRSNVWVGVNPANRVVLNLDWAPHNELRSSRHRTRGEHIHSIQNIMLDIDPDTPERTKAKARYRSQCGRSDASATDEERQRALQLARHIIVSEKLAGTVLCSGNGAQLLIPLHLKGSETSAGRENWSDVLAQYLDDVARRYEADFRSVNCKLDGTADLPRIMSLAGVLKLKGKNTRDRPHEMAYIVDVVGEEDCIGDPTTDPNPNLTKYLIDNFRLRRREDARKARPRSSAHHQVRRNKVPPSLSNLPREPFGCSMWNKFYAEGPVAPKSKRSGTLMALARKLVADGFEPDDAILHLWSFDHRHKHLRRASTQPDPEAYYESALTRARDENNLDCGLANKIFFNGNHKPCDGCVCWSSSPTKSKPWQREKRETPSPPTHQDNEPAVRLVRADDPSFLRKEIDYQRPIPLDEAREVMGDAIRSYFVDYVHSASVVPVDGDLVPILLVKGPPGLGKSTLVRALLSEQPLLPSGECRPRTRAILLAPYKTQLHEMAEHMWTLEPATRAAEGGSVYPEEGDYDWTVWKAPLVSVIKGKLDDGMCQRQGRILAVRKLGYGTHEGAMACRACPDRADCTYFDQFKEKEASWLMVMHYAATHRLEPGQDNDPELIICDEGVLSIAVDRDYFVQGKDLDELAQVIESAWAEDAPLARAARALSRFVRNFDENEGGRMLRVQLESDAPDVSGLLHRGFADEEGLAFVRDLPNRVEHNLVGRNCMPLLQSLHEDFRDDTSGGRVWTFENQFVVRRPADFRFRDRPLIVLDSTGDSKIYESILGRPVHECNTLVDLKCKVYQLAGRYGIRALRETRIREPLLELVNEISKRCGGQLAVICHKEHEDVVRAFLGSRVRVLRHYGAMRGSNEIVDAGCTDLVLLGTPNPNPRNMATLVEALDRQPHGTAQESERRPFLGPDDDGNFLEIDVPFFCDPAMRLWQEQAREGELLQGAYRIRPLDNGAAKTIWVLSGIPIPTLRPNRVFANVSAMASFLQGRGGAVSP